MRTERADVVVLGGAIAGGATALLLRRRHPELRVVVVEKNPAFTWKVGEATVEVSSYFLVRMLRLWDHLSREQLPKQGLRFWFHNARARTIKQASELGGNQMSRLPSFQLDRQKLDEHVLAQAGREGAEVWRPARVVEVRLPEENGSAEGTVRVERDGETIELTAGWIVDATGRACLLGKSRGWVKPIESHPTNAVWARFRGVKDIDGPEVGGTDPRDAWVRAVVMPRRLATNHFTGYGYWIWFIPLNGGETSIGAVWDTRLVTPQGRGTGEKLSWFLQRNPLTRELLGDARPVEGDLWAYQQLPYLVDRVAGPGWSSVGDAAGFLDPFYSPGLDGVTFSVSWTLELIRRKLAKPDPAKFAMEVAEHSRLYRQYLDGLYRMIYRDKYHLMGDYDTLTAAILLDTAFYYRFVAVPIWKRSHDRVLVPPFYPNHADWAVPLFRFYQWRLITIARRKKKLGIYGNRNGGRRPKLIGFDLGFGTFRMLGHGLLLWARAEAEHFLSYLWRPRPLEEGEPDPAPADEQAREPAVETTKG